jgi:hypothetical protein
MRPSGGVVSSDANRDIVCVALMIISLLRLFEPET